MKRALLAAFALACSVLPRGEAPPRLMSPRPRLDFTETLPTARWQLLVDTPTADASLDTRRIAIRRSPREIEYYRGVAWTDEAPELLQRLLVEAFERSGRIAAVGTEATGIRPDAVLETDLRELSATAGPGVLVRISARLVRIPGRRVVASAVVERRAAARSERFEDVLDAFDTALGGALTELVTFTLRARIE